MPSAVRRLSTAEERRETVLEVAEQVFAARGVHGTPTLEIARAAGISHAYLFRLFPTKAELFLSLVRRSNERVLAVFADAAARANAAGEEILPALGRAYVELLQDRDRLLVQLQAHAACDDADVRDEMRRGFADLFELIERESGAGPEAVRSFFAEGMLLNVLASLRADEVDDHWAKVLFPCD